MNTKTLNQEFETMLGDLLESGDLDFALDRIPFKVKEEILKDWEAKQEEKEAEYWIEREIENKREKD